VAVDISELYSTTKTEAIYNSLKDQIMDGNIQAGERMIIREIAKKYKISDSPVREAIKALEAEGFVEIIPHVGARVTGYSAKGIEDALIIREYLEPLAMRLAIEHTNDNIKRNLKVCLEELEQAYKNNNVQDYTVSNRKFHMIIYEASNNPQLIKIIKDLYCTEKRFMALFQKYPLLIDASLEEHKKLYQYYYEENKEALMELNSKHKKRYFDTLREHCRVYNNS